MYIDFGKHSVKGDLFSGEYRARFAVGSKDREDEGTIYFANDKEGTGFIEWCRPGSGQGSGIKMGLEELIRLLENE